MSIFGGLEDNAPDSGLAGSPAASPWAAEEPITPEPSTLPPTADEDTQPPTNDFGVTSSEINTTPPANAEPRNRRPQPRVKLLLRGIEAHKDGSPNIWFDVETDHTNFQFKSYRDVRRTGAELKRFADYISSSCAECFIPVLPPLTKAYKDLQIVSKIMIQRYQIWFNRILSNPFVVTDRELRSFIESKTGYTPLTENINQIPKGFSRKYFKQLPDPEDDIDELREFRPKIKLLYQYAGEGYVKCFKLGKDHQLLGLSQVELSKAIREYGEKSDDQTGTLLFRFGKALFSTGEGERVIGTVDRGTVGEMLEQLSLDSFAMKETLTNRYIKMRQLNESKQALDKLQESTSAKRMNAKLPPVTIDEAERKLDLSVKRLERDTIDLRRVNRSLLIEKGVALNRIEHDTLEAIKWYTLQNIDRERKVLKRWEDFRPAVHYNPQSLSTLGRTEVNHHSRKYSQTKVDEWSDRPTRATAAEDTVIKPVFNEQEEFTLNRNVAIKQVMLGIGP